MRAANIFGESFSSNKTITKQRGLPGIGFKYVEL